MFVNSEAEQPEPSLAASGRVQHALGLVSQLSRSQSLEAAAEVLLAAVSPFGVSTYAAAIIPNPERMDPASSILSNMPDEWTRIYVENKRFLIDPVVVQSLKEPGGFYWRDISEVTSKAGRELFKDARQFGMIDGFTVSSRTFGRLATLVSLSGRELHWSELDQGVVSLLANSFMNRVLYLREQSVMPALKALSPRERRVLLLAAAGRTDKEIVRELGAHASTIKTHWERIRTKLCASDRANAVAMGFWSGQISP